MNLLRSALVPSLILVSLALGGCAKEKLPPHVKFDYFSKQAMEDLQAGNIDALEARLKELLGTERTYVYPSPTNDILNTLAGNASTSSIDQWRQGRPDSSFAHTVQGLRCVLWAWSVRGGKTADEVAAEAWEPFKEHLNNANAELELACGLDPQNPYPFAYMINVDMGLGRDPGTMEGHFRKAVELDPECYTAYANKSLFLLPQWSGSWEEYGDFIDQSAKAAKPGSKVRLLTIEYHRQRASATKDFYTYFESKAVWRSIRSAFEDFLDANPTDGPGNSSFAWWAVVCNDPRKANSLFRRFDTYKDYSPWTYSYWKTEEKYRRWKDWYLQGNKVHPPGFPD